ncbi:histidine--tRNA ligase [Candidatus Pacearchaeota archaeon]|nr:histidine--tRNA ligase [Candidatus Pacearchaeota archaeon]
MTEKVKGFQDYLGLEAEKRSEIKKILARTFEKYGFNPVETPLIEYEKFVKGDNSNDEAISDIFKLKDKGKRDLALRYEFTFQLKRLMENKKLPFKRYQIGEVFRDEPVSTNRFRQFTQCDIDCIGSSEKEEAEVLAVVNEILKTLGISFTIYANNRELLNEILRELNIKDKEDVLREIDKLDKIPEKEVKSNLKKYNAEKLLEILKKPKSYFKKYSSFVELEKLEQFCKYYDVEIKFQPNLSRGLSYYNGNVFEVRVKNMKETICAGGSYIFNKVQSTGLSFGLERLSSLIKAIDKKEKYLIVSLKQDKEAIKLANNLRKQGKIASIYYGKPSKALEYANSYQINNVIFAGAQEIKKKKFKVKDMKTGKEKYLILEKRTKKNIIIKKKK